MAAAFQVIKSHSFYFYFYQYSCKSEKFITAKLKPSALLRVY